MKIKNDKFYNLVDAFNALPSIGKKSALKLAFHLVLKDTYLALKLAHSIESAIKSLRKCCDCGGLSEHELCEICLDEQRQKEILCIVENAKDIVILEENGSFDGLYFVLENLEEECMLNLQSFISKNQTKEIIFALTPNLQNDAIIMFVEDKLKDLDINFTKIAQGIPTGVNIENVDNLSLTKALQSRTKI